MQLLELLELPQLMETCVRQQLYDEALQLDQYARSMKARHPEIKILHQLAREFAVAKLVHMIL